MIRRNFPAWSSYNGRLWTHDALLRITKHGAPSTVSIIASRDRFFLGLWCPGTGCHPDGPPRASPFSTRLGGNPWSVSATTAATSGMAKTSVKIHLPCGTVEPDSRAGAAYVQRAGAALP